MKTENYFSFRLRNCESPYPEDLRKLNYGNLNIFITLHGFIHFDKIAVLKSKGELVNYIKTILADEFTVLPRESINDTYNPNLIISSKKDSSIIVGKDLLQRKLYNQYVHKFHEKVIKGFVWFSDELGGVIYDYLGFHDNNDYNGAQKNSMPFENVIFKYFIAYLEKIRRNREMEDDLNAEGYWNSKEQYETS